MAQNLLPDHLQNKVILILLILIYTITMYNVLYRAFRILCEYFDRGCMTYLSKGLLLTKSLWEVVHVIWYAIRSEFSLLFSDFVGIVRHF